MTIIRGGINVDSNNLIIENIANPHVLERMFRNDPKAFKKSFSHAWEQNPDSQVLAVWYERLNFKETAHTEKASLLQKGFLFMGILAILAGISTRIIFHFVEQQAIAPINLAFGILPFITAYFVYKNKPQKKVLYILALLFLISGVYLNMLPLNEKDSMILVYLHLPIFLWGLTGLAFTGNEYSNGITRLAYLKFNLEFCILYISMAISGMLLAALTMRLFSFIDLNIEDFYFRNVVLFGAAALAIVATYLVSMNLKLAKNITPYIAKIFSPLVLATLLVYLITVISVGKNPFLDRNFLIAFNGILLGVLAVTIFSITESGTDEKKNISDYINFTLIVLALIIDSVALSAIVFRLSSYGITPNRLAVLGVNILICGNLIWIMVSYMRFLQNKTGPSPIQDAVTKYLPVYGLWAAFVTFTFPFIFK
jgi:drug/metabolite transporter superfamily protein YnfA